MQVTLKVPSPLRRYTQNQSQLCLEAIRVEDALTQLFEQCPEMRPQLIGEDGELRNFVNLYLDKVDIKEQQGLATELPEGSELRIVPAIAGGKNERY